MSSLPSSERTPVQSSQAADAASARRMAVPPVVHAWRSRIAVGLLLVAFVVALVYAWIQTEISVDELVRGWHGMADFLSKAFPSDTSVIGDGIRSCGTTLAIAFLGTIFSIPTSLGLALLGARTTSGSGVRYQAARFVMSVLRAVPDIVFALIFVTAVGLGPFPGVLAIMCHNTGVMGKLWSEAMEQSDQGPISALRTAGASRAQIAVHAVLPAIVPQFVGLLLYRFDVNVRSSLVLGLVGAGGIGFLINQSISEFKFAEMMTYILMVLTLIVAVDVISGLVRERLTRP
jgi:phosphonate transport system permease protein